MITFDDILKLISKKISTDDKVFAYPHKETTDWTWSDMAEQIAKLTHTEELSINTYKRLF